MTVYVPAVKVEGTFIDNVDEPDAPDATVSDDELRVAPTSVEDIVSEIVLLNPLSDVTIIVELPEVPEGIVKEDGDAEIEKSAVGGGEGGGGVTI